MCQALHCQDISCYKRIFLFNPNKKAQYRLKIYVLHFCSIHFFMTRLSTSFLENNIRQAMDLKFQLKPPKTESLLERDEQMVT